MVIQAAPEKPDPDHVLTWRQRKILRVIKDSVEARGYPPSMREIGDAVGLTSTASVSFQLATLQRKGFLHRDGRRPRTMEVVLPAQRTAPVPGPSGAPGAPGPERTPPRDLPEPAYVPMVARLAPGIPVLADEQIQDVYPLPRQLVGEGTLFLLTMAGDSMINAAIANGDWLVVRQPDERDEQDEAEDGAIVAAMLDGEAVVRRLKRSDGHVWLMAHNPDFFPLLGDTATILGTVVALLRRV
ncbi:MAG TPA: transcriptional repressor LexA [Trebonia sp.]|nr:transcriptional repressor LexA [Trebonia sp.]